MEKPSMIRSIIASIEANFVDPQTKPQKCKKKFSEYHLVRQIKKNGKLQNFAIGVYERDGKKYFVKIWKKDKKDLSFYSAVNEFRVASVLSEKLKNSSYKARIPDAVEVCQGSDNSYAFVYDFVDGRPLAKFDKNIQMICLKEIISSLNKVSEILTKEERKVFNVRGKIFYLSSIPLLTFISIKENTSKWKHLLKASIDCFLSARKLNKKYSLAHRDIHVGNVMVTDNFIYLLDSEDMVLTLDGFDESDLNIYFKCKIKNKNGFSKPNQNSKFLEKYIAIHRAGNNLRENYYKDYLFNHYE